MVHSFHEDFTDPEFPDCVSLLLLCYFLSTCISFFHSDLLVTALFTPNSSIPQDHLPKYTYLLGYAVSVFEQWEEVSCSRYLFQPSDIFHIETTHFGLQCISDNWFLYGMRHLWNRLKQGPYFLGKLSKSEKRDEFGYRSRKNREI